MLPDWATKPDVILAVALFVLSPVWGQFVIWAWKKLRTWRTSRSEAAASKQLWLLLYQQDHPPTLLESLAYIICALPLPFAGVMFVLAFHFMPQPNNFSMAMQSNARLREMVGHVAPMIYLILCGVGYALFGALSAQGWFILKRLQEGEKNYEAQYAGDMQNSIDKLIKKYPSLKKELGPTL